MLPGEGQGRALVLNSRNQDQESVKMHFVKNYRQKGQKAE